LGDGTVSPAEAVGFGLADRLVPDDELGAAADEMARQLAEGPTMALGLTKQLLLRSSTLDLETFLEFEVLAQSQLVRSADHIEGVRALTQKRVPRFRGR
jgi:2-(1,2-epoxy-1,2-dihydrophenyl)acetyl-CoA isomerase